MDNTDNATSVFNSHKLEKYGKDIMGFFFRFYLLAKLPMAWLAGLKMKSFSLEKAEVTVKHRWLTQNPFRSTYFAVLAMAAEFPTGVLGMQYIQACKKPMSILVVDMKAEFIKKAVGVTTFVSNDGLKFRKAVENAIATGEGETLVAESIGYNKAGEVVAKFYITWSLKVKREKKA